MHISDEPEEHKETLDILQYIFHRIRMDYLFLEFICIYVGAMNNRIGTKCFVYVFYFMIYLNDTKEKMPIIMSSDEIVSRAEHRVCQAFITYSFLFIVTENTEKN